METKLRNVDLNLFLLFDALMQERHVSQAAQKMFLSQSAMSNALNRLRELFNDPILVRTNKGMAPTPLALALENPIREGLKQFQQCFHYPEPFDPENSSKRFIIYCIEEIEYVILPALASRLEKIAPNVTIIAEPLTSKIPETGLTNGEVSAVLSFEGSMTIPKRLSCRTFLMDELVCITRIANPSLGSYITLKEFSMAKHVNHATLMSPFAANTLDSWLGEKNIELDFVITTTAFMLAALVLVETDYIMTVPRRLGNILTKTLPLRIIDLPGEIPKIRTNMIWHPLHENDPSQRWLREQLIQLAKEADSLL